jgi:hypothetical protein
MLPLATDVGLTRYFDSKRRRHYVTSLDQERIASQSLWNSSGGALALTSLLAREHAERPDEEH